MTSAAVRSILKIAIVLHILVGVFRITEHHFPFGNLMWIALLCYCISYLNKKEREND